MNDKSEIEGTCRCHNIYDIYIANYIFGGRSLIFRGQQNFDNDTKVRIEKKSVLFR